MEKIELTEKAGIVLEYLQTQEGPLTGAVIAEATNLNPRGIHGVLNSLVKKELVEKGDKVTMEVVNKDGLKEQRSYTTYLLTPAGAEFSAE
jgi:predicted transcriptional regulator